MSNEYSNMFKNSYSKKISATSKISEITRRERRRKRDINDMNSGHYILRAMTKSTIRTLFGPKILSLVNQK
jgi:hypothetical protein